MSDSSNNMQALATEPEAGLLSGSANMQVGTSSLCPCPAMEWMPS